MINLEFSHDRVKANKIGLDHECPPPSVILPCMNHETKCQGTGVDCEEGGGASVLASHSQNSVLDVGCSMLDVSSPRNQPSFDDFKAAQARADFIAFTKTFWQ